MENSSFISDSEWYQYIDASYGELYDLLVRAQPDFYTKEATIVGVTGTSDYAAPSDHYGTVGIDYIDGDNRRELRHISGVERNAFDYGSGNGPSQGYHFVYGSDSTVLVRLLPSPTTGETYRHRYIKNPSEDNGGTRTIDGISGWEEYIVLDVAIKAMTKEESPTGALEKQLERMTARLEIMAENRTADSAGHVVDSRAAEDYNPASFWRNRP